MQQSQQQTIALLQSYYEAFNAQTIDVLLNTLADDVVHDINQSQREVGKAAFHRYIKRLYTYYREHFFDIEIMTNENGSRAATEYNVLGVYLYTDPGLPMASGQTYRLPGGSFFETRGGKISRVSVHYNMQDWLAQVTYADLQPVTAAPATSI